MIFVGKYSVGKKKVDDWRYRYYRVDALSKMLDAKEADLIEALKERDAMYREVFMLAKKALDALSFDEERGDDIALRFMLSDPGAVIVTFEKGDVDNPGSRKGF